MSPQREEISQSPLHWPDGWIRSAKPTRSSFDPGGSGHTVTKASLEILLQLARMGVNSRDVIVSTNLLYRRDGLPRSGQGQPDDPGAAVWFQLKNERHVMACDRWDRVSCNLWAIAKHLDAMRGQDRWGVGTREQAFRGFTALPAYASGDPTQGALEMGAGDWDNVLSSAADWWVVLEVDPDTCTVTQINTAYRDGLKGNHPDLGGDGTISSGDLQQARNLGIAAVAKRPRRRA